jgi:hypothetical protein
MTYGGNEEIVLKGPKGARKSQKQEKTESYRAKECICTTFIRYSFARIRTEAENGNAAADVGQREYNIYKGQKKYPGQEAILVLEKDSQRRSVNFKQGNGDYGGMQLV